jgi:hypothetical protein
MDKWQDCIDEPVTPFPVNVGGVLAPEHLIGRQQSIEAVNTFIVDSPGVVLTGDRRIGKTSLLGKLESDYLEVGHHVIKVSAETTKAETFASNLVTALGPQGWLADEKKRWTVDIVVSKWGVTLRRTGKNGEKSQEDLFEWAAKRAAPNLLIVIIDELTVLLQALSVEPADAVEFMHSLRRARQAHPNLKMIFAGSIGLHHVVPDGHGTTNDMQRVQVGALEPCEAVHLARCLIAGMQLVTDDERALAEAIARTADSIPYYVHYVVQRLVQRDGSSSADLPPNMMTEAMNDAEDPLDFRHYDTRLKNYFGSDAPTVRKMLDHYAMDGASTLHDVITRLRGDGVKQLDRDAMLSLLNRLERDHYLVRLADGSNDFSSELLRCAWIAMRRLG